MLGRTLCHKPNMEQLKLRTCMRNTWSFLCETELLICHLKMNLQLLDRKSDDSFSKAPQASLG